MMFKTIRVLPVFAIALLAAGAASAHGHSSGGGHSAPTPTPTHTTQPAVSVGAAVQAGGRSGLNVAAAVKSPLADVGLATSVNRGGTELSLDLGLLNGGVGR